MVSTCWESISSRTGLGKRPRNSPQSRSTIRWACSTAFQRSSTSTRRTRRPTGSSTGSAPTTVGSSISWGSGIPRSWPSSRRRRPASGGTPCPGKASRSWLSSTTEPERVGASSQSSEMTNMNGSTAPLLKTKDLVKTYSIGGTRLIALNKVNLTFERGEFAGLIGPSGSGKTTLLNILGTLDRPTEGSAEVLGHRVENLSHTEAAELRSRHISFIFQTHNLLPVYTVYENVEFPLLVLGTPAAERHKKVMDALQWVRLADRASSKPAQLSGGQSQRVAIARAIVKRPEIVLADEPTANLDAENSRHVLDTMEALSRDLQTTFIFATHDEKVIRYLRRKIVLSDGVIIEDRVVQSSPVKEAVV